MSKKLSFPKSYYMWAVISSKQAMKPWKIYSNKRDADYAVRYNHEHFPTTWGDCFVRRILVIQQDKTHFDIYKHEFKRI